MLRRACLLLLFLTTIAHGQSVSLTWNPPVLQPGQVLTGYQVGRCPLPAGATTCTCTPVLLPGVMTATIWTETPPAGTYCYSVIALGTVDGQAGVSDFATPLLRVTLGTPPLAAPAALTVRPLVTPSLLTVTADSAETQKEPGAASRASDGNPATFWHTQYTPTVTPVPHWLRLDLPGTWWLVGLRYLPRQDAGINGTIADYRVEVLGTDSVWREVAKGTWPSAGTGWLEVRWPLVLAQSVRLWALREVRGGPWASAAEVQVMQGQAPP